VKKLGSEDDLRKLPFCFRVTADGKPPAGHQKAWAACAPRQASKVQASRSRHTYCLSSEWFGGHSLPLVGPAAGHTQPSTTPRTRILGRSAAEEGDRRIRPSLTGKKRRKRKDRLQRVPAKVVKFRKRRTGRADENERWLLADGRGKRVGAMAPDRKLLTQRDTIISVDNVSAIGVSLWGPS